MRGLGGLALLVLTACVRAPVEAVMRTEVLPAGGPWSHALRAEHRLVGRIWSVESRAFVSEEVLVEALRAADWRLLGEKHDNADHHRLQARLIAALAPPAVAFEQLDDGDPIGAPEDPAALAEAVSWEESGWPEFAIYEPVFAATLGAGARVVPAHPTREQLMGAGRGGLEVLGDAAEGLRLDVSLSDGETAELEAEIVASHCGHADGRMVAMMVGMQRLKDAWMARALGRAGAGTVLVAGNGHTRKDRGVPVYLDGKVVTVALLEVEAGVEEVTGYEAIGEAADFVWFTPRVDEVDPCERYREALEGMRARCLHSPPPASTDLTVGYRPDPRLPGPRRGSGLRSPSRVRPRRRGPARPRAGSPAARWSRRSDRAQGQRQGALGRSDQHDGGMDRRPGARTGEHGGDEEAQARLPLR
jgi:uncharacterized iron-regulated protein